MEPPTFLDTGAIYAFADANDHDHDRILAAYANAKRSFVLHELILVESFSLITKRLSKRAAMRVVGLFRSTSRVEKVPADSDLLAAGWARCQRYADKEWDWVDCVSFELMERRNIREALSLDRHFTQAGFTLVI